MISCILNLLNQLEERRCQALPSILSTSPNNLNIVSNTGAQLQDSIYHMTLELHLKLRFSQQNVNISPLENLMFL